jgi:hypothetical protein
MAPVTKDKDTDKQDATVAKASDVSAESVKQDKPVATVDENAIPQYYVHLANGTVLRVDEEDLPARSGSNAHFGHWQTGNKVYQVIGVYPVEDTVKDAN